MLQDYARWHSYQFYLSTRTVDPTLRPTDALDVRKPLPFLSSQLIGSLGMQTQYA